MRSGRDSRRTTQHHVEHDRPSHEKQARGTHHRVEIIVAAGGAHLAMVSEGLGDSPAAAEQQVYDRASRLGPAVCVALELPTGLG